MKKLIQVSLIVVLVFVMVQAVIGGTMALTGQTRSNEVQSTYFTTIKPVQNVRLLICPDGRGVSCMRPNVGWNS
jgi:heme A synthase